MALPPPVPLSRDSGDRTPIFIPAAPEGRWMRPRVRHPLRQALFVGVVVVVVLLAITQA